jgi:hypothetical protein
MHFISWAWTRAQSELVEHVRNLMAHAQKPDFVFRLNGRVHLNRRGNQFSRLLAAEVCASALVMLDTLRSEVVWEYWLPTPLASFPFTSFPVRHRVPPHSERSIRCIMGKFLGVVCHCFPSSLDTPTFAARCSTSATTREILAAKGGTMGEKDCLVILPTWRLYSRH